MQVSVSLSQADLDAIAAAVCERLAAPGPEPYIGKAELAEAFRCSVRWIEDRLREGMPSVLLAGARKFRRSEVEAWLRAAGHLRTDASVGYDSKHKKTARHRSNGPRPAHEGISSVNEDQTIQAGV